MANLATSNRNSTQKTVNALYENKAATTRTSPRKRKDPPSQTAETPPHLKRIKKSLLRPKPPTKGQRTDEYDYLTDDDAEALQKTKKMRNLKPNAQKRDHFQGVDRGTMHLRERDSLDSPAKGTRSHGLIQHKIQDIGIGLDHSKRDGKSSAQSAETGPQKPTKTSQRPNPLVNAAQAAEPATPKRGRGHHPKAPPSSRENGNEEEGRDGLPTRPTTAEEQNQENLNEDDPERGGSDEPEKTAQEEQTDLTTKDFEAGREEYGCGDAWRAILKIVGKITEERGSPRHKTTKTIVEMLKAIKNGYRTIELSDHSETSLNDAEAAVKDGISELESICARLDKRILETDLVREVYEQAISRSVSLGAFALRVRFAKRILTADAVQEIFDILEVAFQFCNVTVDAKHRPGDLDIDKQVRNIVRPNLRRIRKQYLNTIEQHKFAIAREAERMKRAAMVAREQEREAERKLREAEEYQEALRINRVRDRDRNTRLELEEVERLAKERKRWQDKLMADPSEEAVKLCRKLGLTLHGQQSRLVHPTSEVHDIDDWEMDGPHLPVNGTRNSTNVRHPERPKPQREPTADIPAEPQAWTKEEKIAFSNGLQDFQGPNRYHDILNAPRYGYWLRERDEMELMQMGLFLKQSMASRLKKSGGELQGDWGYLMSIPG